MPKVSVLMSVYNTKEKFLREAIESILSQTFTDFEFLIVNDGSQNNSEEVILSYKDDRIKYIINEKNLGLVGSLNKGLKIAQGEYIARFDADDISLPQRLEKQVKFMDENPNVGLLGTQYESFPKKRISNLLTDSKLIKETLLVESNQFGHPTVMIRKSVLDNYNLQYDKRALHMEDYKMWLDISKVTEIANLSEILLHYRRHPGSTCSKNVVEQNLNVQKFLFMAQSEFFGINADEQLKTIEKLQNKENISAHDLEKITEFVNQVREKMKEKNFTIEYRLNHPFAKYALKKCKKDFNYFKILISGRLKTFYEK